MAVNASSIDRFRSLLVVAATIGTVAFNWIAAAGYVNGVTPGEISAKYPTVITPSGYAFSIWSLIYVGLLAFSILQASPRYLERFRQVRSPYILSCALNCAWIYFWHNDQIAICLALILFLLGVLVVINYKIRIADSTAEALLAKGPFGLYMGWLTAAALANFAVLLVYLKVDLGSSANIVGGVLVLAAAAIGVLFRVRLFNYFAPLAVAWALTAIAIKQSGRTLIVLAAAVGVVACLIAALSFVMNLNSSSDERR